MKKYFKFLQSLLKHKWFVFLECCKLGIPWLGIIHDWTKFLPSEFIPYAKWFYGDRLEVMKVMVLEKGPYRFGQLVHYDDESWAIAAKNAYQLGLVPWEDKENFDMAWLHHQKRNKHHWQRWELVNGSDEPQRVALPMPEKYCLEMIADWRGAGRAYGNPDTDNWYSAHRCKQRMHNDTRSWIDGQMNYV